MALATFGAGCFWGVELTFQQLDGVISATSGYEGGTLENPTYEDVCTNQTGHAEVVQVDFDPTVISYEALLDVFWRSHNPTHLNRQGADIGSQYRSVIFYHDDEQKKCAEASRDKLVSSAKYGAPIATVIEPASTFYPAEDYHQKYLEKRGLSACHT